MLDFLRNRPAGSVIVIAALFLGLVVLAMKRDGSAARSTTGEARPLFMKAVNNCIDRSGGLTVNAVNCMEEKAQTFADHYEAYRNALGVRGVDTSPIQGAILKRMLDSFQVEDTPALPKLENYATGSEMRGFVNKAFELAKNSRDPEVWSNLSSLVSVSDEQRELALRRYRQYSGN